MYRNLRIVPQLVYGRGSIAQLSDILSARRTDTGGSTIYLIDDVHESRDFVKGLPLHTHDMVVLVNVDVEPKTSYVDELVEQVRGYSNRQPEAVVGIGGGSTLDLAKAIKVLLTNPGSASDYQGWDLVRYPGVFGIGIPTLAATGAEVSRTAVLTGPERKLGINSDHTPFDQIVLDPDLCATVPGDQRFFTAMDCYIHAAESLRGTFINEFSRAYAEKSLEMCREVFLDDIDRELADEKLMIASYFGGLSIAYSQVGVCHALSYGLSFTLGTHHGIGNCIVFDKLGEYYPEDVDEFRRMVDRHDIELPRGICEGLGGSEFDEMIEVALGLEPLWENALGPRWRALMPPEKVRSLYEHM